MKMISETGLKPNTSNTNVRPHVSVCMATYQGDKYLEKQIDSILSQLLPGDELIISDDGSTDATLEIVSDYISRGAEIRLVLGPCKGFNSNFEHAFREATGDIIFISDQDDEWLPNKLNTVLMEFGRPEVSVVVHDAIVVNSDGALLHRSLLGCRNGGTGLLRNLVRNSYTGCCMALRKSFLEYVLPFPNGIAYYDWWIGLVADSLHASSFIDTPLIKYRRHGGNTSPSDHYPLLKMFSIRLKYICSLIDRRMSRSAFLGSSK